MNRDRASHLAVLAWNDLADKVATDPNHPRMRLPAMRLARLATRCRWLYLGMVDTETFHAALQPAVTELAGWGVTIKNSESGAFPGYSYVSAYRSTAVPTLWNTAARLGVRA